MTSRLQFTVGQQGSYLATRDRARTLREDLERRIRACADLDELTIDFSGVEAMTISYADEFLGHLFVALAVGDIVPTAVALVGLNDETRETMAICLERRDLIAVDAERQALLGKAEALEDTYQCALRLGTFRASELASEIGITPQNANNRLKKLLNAGALVRQRLTDVEGKEFSYTLPARQLSRSVTQGPEASSLLRTSHHRPKLSRARSVSG